MSSVLILGATSSIARAIAAEYARDGHDLMLAGRDEEELAIVAADLRVRHGVRTCSIPFDAVATQTHEAFWRECLEAAGDSLLGVVLCFGALGPQATAQTEFSEAKRIIDSNFTGAVSILHLIAGHMEKRRSGFIGVISSVAGERGRKSNYVYGAAKAGLSIFLEGLRNRLFPAGVRVTTIKPGFVDTKMTYGLPGLFLVATPQGVGAAIVRGIRRGRNVVYVPWFWRYIMVIFRAIPEPIFKRLKL